MDQTAFACSTCWFYEQQSSCETHVGSVCGERLSTPRRGPKHRAVVKAQKPHLAIRGGAGGSLAGLAVGCRVVVLHCHCVCVTHTAARNSFQDTQELNQIHPAGADLRVGYAPHQCKRLKPYFPGTQAERESGGSAEGLPKPLFLRLRGGNPSIRCPGHRAALVKRQHREAPLALPQPASFRRKAPFL